MNEIKTLVHVNVEYFDGQEEGDDGHPYYVANSPELRFTAVGDERGFDGGKQVKGRKRHILVDSLGNLLKVMVTVATMHEGKAAIELLKTLPNVLFKRLKRIGADGGYRGEFVDWGAKKFKKIIVDITLRSDDQKGFEVIPWRWVVERSFCLAGPQQGLRVLHRPQ